MPKVLLSFLPALHTCPFAFKYDDRVDALAKKYRQKGYVLLGINPNDPEVQPKDNYKLMQQKARNKGIVFPYLVNDGQKIYPQYGATKTLHVFLFYKNHVVRFIGAIDNNLDDASAVKEKYLENAIATLESGKDTSLESTEAIGCSIKAKK